jgi:hypothetical protein
MKKTKLLLLSSIFLVYGTYDAMSASSVAPTPSTKRTFDKAELQEEIDPNEGGSEAAQRLQEIKEKEVALKAEIADKNKELQIVAKEVQEASKNAGSEVEDCL